MPAPVILYIDTTNKAQVASFLTSQQPGSQTELEAGDLVPFQLHFLQKNSTAAASSSTLQQLPYSYIDPSTVTPVSMAIGALGAIPTAGTFTVTFGANTTPAQAFNVSAATLQTALNALASVTTAGGVVVTGNAGGPYRVAFNTVGAQTLFAIGATNLSPTSLGITARAVAGTGSFAEVQVLRLVQTPAALQNTWTATYGAISISRLQAGGAGLNEIQRVTVPQGTYAGGFSLAFGAASTGSQAYNVTASALQTALQALSTIGANNATVIQSSTVTWDITFTGTMGGLSQSLIVANGTGLQMPQYLAANIDLNVEGVFDLLFAAGANSADAVLQVQQGSTVNTVLQVPVTVNNTLIQGTPSVPNPVDPWQTLSQVNALIAASAYTLPTASTTVLGGVKIDGTSISITAGVIRVTGLTLANTLTTAGNFALTLTQTGTTNVTLPTTGTLATRAGTETLTGKTLTSPTINGGVVTALTGLAVRDTSAAFDVTLAATSSTALTAGRTLTLDMVNAARTLKLTGNPTLADWFDQSVKTTSSPTHANLTINNTATAAGIISLQGTQASAVNYQILNAITGVSNSGFSVRDTTNSINVLAIDGTGNPSFGAYNGTSQFLLGGTVTGQKYFYVKNSSGDCQFGVFPAGGAFIGSTTATALQFYSNNAVALTLDTAGNATIAAGLAFSPATTATAPAAGGAGALPATPLGYATVTILGVARKIAYY